MKRHGFIHEKVDIKKLILFILSRLEAPIARDTLTELIFFDDGIGYFDYSACIAELEAAEHIQIKDGRIAITELGKRNGMFLEDSLPYTVRREAEERAAVLARAQRRSTMLKAEIKPRALGGFTVKLALSDGLGEILNLELYAATEAQAAAIANGFERRAEQVYSKLIALLIEE